MWQCGSLRLRIKKSKTLPSWHSQTIPEGCDVSTVNLTLKPYFQFFTTKKRRKITRRLLRPRESQRTTLDETTARVRYEDQQTRLPNHSNHGFCTQVMSRQELIKRVHQTQNARPASSILKNEYNDHPTHARTRPETSQENQPSSHHHLPFPSDRPIDNDPVICDEGRQTNVLGTT